MQFLRGLTVYCIGIPRMSSCKGHISSAYRRGQHSVRSHPTHRVAVLGVETAQVADNVIQLEQEHVLPVAHVRRRQLRGRVLQANGVTQRSVNGEQTIKPAVRRTSSRGGLHP